MPRVTPLLDEIAQEGVSRADVLRDVLAGATRRLLQDISLSEDDRESGVDTITALCVHAASRREDRRRAHQDLADNASLSAFQRLLHRADGFDGIDEHLVDALEDAAAELVARFRYRAATSMVLAAARHTASANRAAALLTRASSISAFSGHLDLHRHVASIAEAVSLRHDGAVRPQLQAVAAAVFAEVTETGDVHAAFHHVVSATDQLPDAADPDVINLHVGSCLAYGVATGRRSDLAHALQRAVKFERILDPVNVMISRSLSVSGPTSHVRALDQRGLRGAVVASLREGDPWKSAVLYLALPALFWNRDQARWLTDVGTPHPPRVVGKAALSTAAEHAADGHFSLVLADQVPLEGTGRLHRDAVERIRALVRTLCGEPPRGPTHASNPAGAEWIAVDLVSQSRFDVAFERMRHQDLSPVRWIRNPYGPLEMLDFVECCVRLRRHSDAVAYLHMLRHSRPDFWSAREAALMIVAQALLSDTADAMFDASLREIHEVGWAFDIPRVALAYGEWQRRNHRVRESRRQLSYAADLFARLGTTPWVRRAEEELRAAGVPQRDPDRAALVELTGQEYRIASLAASGLTNKDIGEQLFLSARTVGGHLYRVFPKLGITSRSALRDALQCYDARFGTLVGV